MPNAAALEDFKRLKDPLHSLRLRPLAARRAVHHAMPATLCIPDVKGNNDACIVGGQQLSP